MDYYLVTNGLYSERVVVGLFSDRVTAQYLVDHLGEEAMVIQVPLDRHTELIQQGKKPYEVKIDEHGSVKYCSPINPMICNDPDDEYLYGARWTHFEGQKDGSGNTRVWASTPEEAEQLAFERYRQHPRHS